MKKAGRISNILVGSMLLFALHPVTRISANPREPLTSSGWDDFLKSDASSGPDLGSGEPGLAGMEPSGGFFPERWARLTLQSVALVSMQQVASAQNPAENEDRSVSEPPMGGPPAPSVLSSPDPQAFRALAAGAILRGFLDRGVVVAGDDEREMLGPGDRIYLRPSRVPLQPGQEWALVRAVRKVSHPVTHQELGFLIKVVGEMKVIRLADGLAEGRIIQAFDEVQAGDGLFQIPTPNEETRSKRPEGLTGVIVETAEDRVGSGFLDIVYLDRGKRDGVAPGDRFSILRSGRNMTIVDAPSKEDHLPDRRIGELEIVSSQEETSTARVTQSNEPIERGDHLALLPSRP